jgi:nucleoside phosphorylase
MASTPAKPVRREDIHIAIICALTHEGDAVETLFDGFWGENGYLGKIDGDPNGYTIGYIGSHNVVLVRMPEIGKKAASGVGASMKSSFMAIQLALVVGNCGACPHGRKDEDIIMGDVIISEGVIEYDMGRQFSYGFIRRNRPKEVLGRPSLEVRSLLASLKGRRARKSLEEKLSIHLEIVKKSYKNESFYPGVEKDILYESSYQHRHHRPTECTICSKLESSGDAVCDESRSSTCQALGCHGHGIHRRRLEDAQEGGRNPSPQVHFGVIASGDTVMKSGQHRDIIAAQEEIIAFEMESAGIWDHLSCIVVKGVCDYADSHKNNIWQDYAAATAASAVKAFLTVWRPTPVEFASNVSTVPQYISSG